MTIVTESTAAGRPFSPARLFRLIADKVATWREARRMLKELDAMEDHILDDIGLSRRDVVLASVAEIGTDRMSMISQARTRRMA